MQESETQNLIETLEICRAMLIEKDPSLAEGQGIIYKIDNRLAVLRIYGI